MSLKEVVVVVVVVFVVVMVVVVGTYSKKLKIDYFTLRQLVAHYFQYQKNLEAVYLVPIST